MATNFENRYIDAARTEELRLSDYFDAVSQHWCMILVITLAALLAGAALAFLQRPVYQANAVIQVEDSNNANADANKDALQSLASIFDSKSPTAAQIELIRSRLVVDATVRDLHLDIAATPRYFPVVGRFIASRRAGDGLAEPLFGMRNFAWGGEQISVTLFDTPKDLYGKPFVLTMQEGGSYVLRDRKGVVVLQARTGEVAVGTTPAGPVRLRVDELTARPGTQFELTRSSTLDTVDKLQRALGVVEVTVQSGIIGVTLEGPNSELTAAIVNSIARQFVQQDIDRKSAEAEHTLAFLDQQLPQLRKELDLAEERYNTFRNRQGTVDLSEESRLLLQQIVDNKTKLIDLQQQRVELGQRFTATHPSVAALDAQIGALQSVQGKLSHSVSSLPDTEQTALRLLRDVRVDTELYTNLLNSAQQLRIVKAGQIGTVRVVDYAEPADKPVRPQRPLVIGISGGIGLFIGMLLAFVRRTLFGGVQHPQEIERALGLPVCAIVPRSSGQLRMQQNVGERRAGVHVLAVQAPHDVAIEGVRSLRTSLHNALASSRNNIIMLTGSRPDAGKSFLSVNLAALVASAKKRVLLIDGDMRRGDIHRHFGMGYAAGLSNLLIGADPGDCVVRNVLPGLDVLPRGDLPGNPSELLMSERFRSLLEYFSAAYELVVIDTPPVLAVTDAALIGKHVGTALMVVRHGRHPMVEISEAVKRLSNAGVTLNGLLLTDVPQPRPYQRGAYASYYAYEGRMD
ncbi:polysaccharide biosynthesis tyrosine autokinase [Paraburkholderia sp. BL10I2N1]|uniref:polysaccharide biosynthesis tyrosine autokinase n=1 Tax=Paraburkholderia sp. BL10I2N1 TaxID=1938796 RepID=UPI00105F3D41|nr:polysaccharide biosynthesis tyrosine autokinase [Paraburkholderia sp. BL10I2N1]